MTERQQELHIKELLEKGNTKARAFYLIGKELRNQKITKSDFFAMSESLGFPISVREQEDISLSLHVWLGVDFISESSKSTPKA